MILVNSRSSNLKWNGIGKFEFFEESELPSLLLLLEEGLLELADKFWHFLLKIPPPMFKVIEYRYSD